uniref:ribonuclease H n=1 Tax=Nothobranchius rachovii TaxID=451742 RepID=A0A1A8NMF2_9TELE
MKVQYDKTATRRNFAVGDKVLVLTPVSNSALSTKFEGPFEILSKLGDTNYVLHTPARRQKSRVCHVNMLKRYEDGSPLSKPVTCVVVPKAAEQPMVPQEAGEVGEDFPSSCSPRLNNSEALKELEGRLTHLSPEIAGDLVKLIHSRKSLFVDVPTQTTVLAHHVEVSEAKPIRQHPYRASPEKRRLMKEETEYLLKNGFAIPSWSPWSSPCLVERKPDGTARFITDYRKLNAVTISDSYPLPRIDDCVDSVGPSRFVTKLDLLKGYWQVPLTEEASLMSAFVTPDAFLQYTVLPFGMKNAPATFQRLINTVTSGLSHCSAYLDDIVVYTDTWEEHLHTLTQLFDRLVQANLTLNLAKVQDQLSPKRRFEWTSECQASFEAAKLLLCSAPVLAAPDLARPFKLEVDASAVAAGSVLIQEDSAGIDHPVCYFSKKFNRHQLHYSTIEKETLALLLSLQHFHVYVGSSCSPTVVFTDHNPLTFLSRMYNQNQRLMRWALILQEYSIEVRHKKGTTNVIADGLSRCYGNL